LRRIEARQADGQPDKQAAQGAGDQKTLDDARSAVKLGVLESVAVLVIGSVSKYLDGMAETALLAILVTAAVAAVAFLPGLWTRATTIEGIAGAAGIGLAATVVFLVFDVELLFLYPWAATYLEGSIIPAGFRDIVFWEVQAFLLTVVIISILLYSLLPPLDLLPRILSRLVLLPVIAGIAYEFLKFTASRQSNPLIRLLTKPNLAMQRLTTREPDMDMLAVAIAAFENVLAYERSQTAVATGDTVIAAPAAAEPAA